jgi:hypothetical protein
MRECQGPAITETTALTAKSAEKEAGRFWMPLLGRFTGARVEVEDISSDERGALSSFSL